MIAWWSIRLIHWFRPTAIDLIDALIFALFFALCAVNDANSQALQDEWIPPTGDWSTAGNWSFVRVPPASRRCCSQQWRNRYR